MITLRPIQFVDPALKSEKDPGVKTRPDGTVVADWFSLCTANRVGQLVYLLDIFRAQIPFPAQVKAMFREHKQWKSWKIGIENNAYQWALGQAAFDKNLPVVPVNFPGDKVFKAQLATPHFETGRVRIRGVKENGVLVAHPAFRHFMKESSDFPFGINDDDVDSVCGAVLMCTSPEFLEQDLVVSKTQGFGVVVAGGTGRVYHADPFDQFRSNF